MQLKLDGYFFECVKQLNHYSEEEIEVMQRTNAQLKAHSTDTFHPGMLLGRIQSGKTRSYIGMMALALDDVFDCIVILTKNSNALARQTYERVAGEFRRAMDEDMVIVHDIIRMPKLRKYELKQKQIIIVKKEIKNVTRLEQFFIDYPEMKMRKVMFIDDEADYASVVYSEDKDRNLIELKKIATKLDDIKAMLPTAAYLQVTATPYSLYLQPDADVLAIRGYQPKRPAFTVLVPTHDKYVGGKFYFEDQSPAARSLYHAIDESELEVLRKPDNRRVKDDYLLTSKNLEGLRHALLNFIVGAKVRHLSNGYITKYSFIMHTITTKKAHVWQYDVVSRMESKLKESITEDPQLFRELVYTAYEDLKHSVQHMPDFSDVLAYVKSSLIDEELLIEIVNSEQDVDQLLNYNGELRLRTPMTFFIGGQILDRGITVGNLIGFYYGRDPRKFQQDTVLQHSRMYGARPMEDMEVTRFYTTPRIYSAMQRMHFFDEGLREAIMKQDHTIKFLTKDAKGEIIPCSPNKLLMSELITVKPRKRFLPVGFETVSKTKLNLAMKRIDKMVSTLEKHAVRHTGQNVLVPVQYVRDILMEIQDTFIYTEGMPFHMERYVEMIEYLSEDDLVWVIVRTNRNISRLRSDGRFADRPDTGHDELQTAYKLGKTHPSVILLRQNGLSDSGWKDAPFYWPVIVAQSNMQTTIFS
ncbi:Z1 domain-containing protein [Macrococcus armenti]|uniref:Z1 domain-containing protein n=1 Tax=Macrococcus armenti TaxID=2875764 RepID=UPI001CCE4029|nr:Z1 domain-containing protein [Macrococcus armenti]UBH09004.1 Z1 domain-containing protein [Macrococcus armenti]UBH11295.1 Z1 domain-containing protein [Macrococcus armenti]